MLQTCRLTVTPLSSPGGQRWGRCVVPARAGLPPPMTETPTPRHSGPLNLNQGVVPQRDTWQGQETFFLDCNLGVGGILLHLVDRSKYAAQHCTMHGTVPTTKNDLAPSVNSAWVETPRGCWVSPGSREPVSSYLSSFV